MASFHSILLLVLAINSRNKARVNAIASILFVTVKEIQTKDEHHKSDSYNFFRSEKIPEVQLINHMPRSKTINEPELCEELQQLR